jgi:Na+/H+ antiporter NhaD/arsenite permease-like protein
MMFLLLFPGNVVAAQGLPAESMGLTWCLPFVFVLFSLALMPLAFPRFWHHHYGKLIIGYCLLYVIPAVQFFGFSIVSHEILHVLLSEYMPFIILIASLFVTTGGIHLSADWLGTPKSNVLVLLSGTFLASIIGTTGASMLLVRPIIRANAWRKHTVHTMVIFIFLVANIGGALTPLGDPPLFLGFLEGVPFFWPTKNLFLPMVTLSGCLLAIYYFMDKHYYSKETEESPYKAQHSGSNIKFQGRRNFYFLAGIIGGVLISGFWHPDINFDVFGIKIQIENFIRDAILLLMTILSLVTTRNEVRQKNHFSWDPLLEVMKIFFGIFVTVSPVIAILKAGHDGALSQFMEMVTKNNVPYDPAYFWFTGIFSSFLDNAPTYYVFFHMAGGNVAELTSTLSSTLVAISTGAVFMGAVTYIGNAPNFMIKSIAEKRGIRMPSFFGYMAWSIGILLPLFLFLTFAFF